MLTHWCLGKIATISLMIYRNVFSLKKCLALWSNFHCSMFPGVQLTISQHVWGNGLAPNRRQVIAWTSVDQDVWCHMASLGHNNRSLTEIGQLSAHVYGNVTRAILMTSSSVLSDPPGPPRKVRIDDLSKSACTICWKAPESDGGSPIIGYYVERKQPFSSMWTKVRDIEEYLNATVFLTHWGQVKMAVIFRAIF